MTHHEQREERLLEPMLFSFSSELIVLWDLKMEMHCKWVLLDKMNMCINKPETYRRSYPQIPGQNQRKPKSKKEKRRRRGESNKLIMSKHISLVFMYMGFPRLPLLRTEEYCS